MIDSYIFTFISCNFLPNPYTLMLMSVFLKASPGAYFKSGQN